MIDEEDNENQVFNNNENQENYTIEDLQLQFDEIENA